MTEQFIISPQLGIPGPPEYLQVFNTSFTYINIQWTPPRYFFYITCQTEMDFGVVHNEAMDKRLHKCYFKSLPRVEPDANKWLREHAIECIVWAQNIVGSTARSATLEPVVP